MLPSRVVGSRELKTRLGQYLNRVRKGETLLITDRNEPVAELRPISDAVDPVIAALHKLAATGAMTLPARKSARPFTALRVHGSPAGSAAGAVSRDRDERG